MAGRDAAARTGGTGAPVERAWQVHKAHTRSAIEESSLRLFAERGFDDTTVEELAEAAGVARRTFFRYFPSKNDVIFGSYEEHLDILRAEMRAVPPGTTAVEAVHRGFRAANDYRPEELPTLAIRIRLMLEVPSLRAHAAWRYTGYERVVADAVTAHLGEPPGLSGLYATALARASVGVMWAAYAHWLAQGAGPDLATVIDDAFTLLTTGFPDPPSAHADPASPSHVESASAHRLESASPGASDSTSPGPSDSASPGRFDVASPGEGGSTVPGHATTARDEADR